jgi:hypothetical protein
MSDLAAEVRAHAIEVETLRSEATRLREALEDERGKFQRETLRTSAQAQLLARAEALLCNNHGPGAWAKGCERCALVGEMQVLRETPINAAAALGTTEASNVDASEREELAAALAEYDKGSTG